MLQGTGATRRATSCGSRWRPKRFVQVGDEPIELRLTEPYLNDACGRSVASAQHECGTAASCSRRAFDSGVSPGVDEPWVPESPQNDERTSIPGEGLCTTRS